VITISDRQMRALNAARRRQYEDKVLRHVSFYFPEQFEKLGEQGVRDLVPLGIGKCKIYGITRECDVTDFVALMVVLGPDFDNDPELPWVSEMLEGEGLDPDAKMASLYACLPRDPALKEPAWQDRYVPQSSGAVGE